LDVTETALIVSTGTEYSLPTRCTMQDNLQFYRLQRYVQEAALFT